MTHAAAHDGSQLGAVLDRDNTASNVWAEPPTARRPTSPCSTPRPRAAIPAQKAQRQAMPAHITRGNVTRARIRSRVQHVFAAQKCRLGLVSHRRHGARPGQDRPRQPCLQFHPAGRAPGSARARVRHPPATRRITKPPRLFAVSMRRGPQGRQFGSVERLRRSGSAL